MLFLENKRKSHKILTDTYPDGLIIDVTSKARDGYVKFSPFYPHGNIPVLYSDLFSFCVEGIWQRLKIFEFEDIDISKFLNNSMKNLKRNGKKIGQILGHRKGISSMDILNYIDARKEIYIPSYNYVLDNILQKEISILRAYSKKQDVVLLDYNTNRELENTRTPLSHASLIISYIENTN